MQHERNTKAVKLAVRHYWRQIKHDWKVMLPGMVLPGIGTIIGHYVPILAIAGILTLLGKSANPSWAQLAPLIIVFAASWAAGETIWRFAFNFLIKGQTRGQHDLYLKAM